jgi:hypothetical protein
VKAADQQFGGLAYGTVVLLATVVANKQRREKAIEEMLEEITYAFPDSVLFKSCDQCRVCVGSSSKCLS